MWLNPGGVEMSDEEWGMHYVKTVGVLLCGDALDVRDWQGAPITDDTFLMLLNASPDEVAFTLPNHVVQRWVVVIDTADESGFPEPAPEHEGGSAFRLFPRHFCLLRKVT